MPKPENEKIPITLVTGFLGAGKTTLLNHILKHKGSRRVAVVENEVGEVNIDNSLVVDNLLSKEDLVSMDRGCVCCSLRHDIVKALRELQTRAAARGSNYDAILFETTGLADPAPVAFTFFSNAWISSNFRLDSILCLVDAQFIFKHLEDASSGVVNEAVNQIAFADVILLNKIDLVLEEQLQHARDLVRSINVTAELFECQLNSDSDEQLPGWDTLMGINSFSIERAQQVDPYFMDSDSEDEQQQEGDGEERRRERVAGAGQQVQQQQQAGASVAPGAEAQLVNEEEGQQGGGPAALVGAQQGEAGSVLGKRKAAEVEEEGTGASAQGNCGQYWGPCDVHCDRHTTQQVHEAEGKQQDAEQPHQRQPKRRRKKLHDLSGVGALGITARGPLDKHRFNMFMRDLLGEKARDIFRSKGVLSIKGQERTKFVFQGVHETICFGPAAMPWAEDEEPINQIVFIGRNLSRRDLVEGLRSCVWVPLPEGWQEHLDPRTNQPYYINSATGAKQWERPEDCACALVQVTESDHKQPSRFQPRHAKGKEVETK